MKISEFFNKNAAKGKIIALTVMLFGAVLLIFSSVFESKSTEKESVSFTDELSEYSAMLEDSLKRAVSEIVGDESTSVMITFESTFENVYYSDAVVNEAVTADKTDRKSEKQLVLTGDAGRAQNPVVVKMLSPKVSGAVIVCRGGDSEAIKQRVTELASCALNISKNKIYVTGGN